MSTTRPTTRSSPRSPSEYPRGTQRVRAPLRSTVHPEDGVLCDNTSLTVTYRTSLTLPGLRSLFEHGAESSHDGKQDRVGAGRGRWPADDGDGAVRGVAGQP